MWISSAPKHIYTVSELTSELKNLLEEKYPFIWIYGEISNFRKPASGHFYFTLKDEKAQISAVMFRAQQMGLKFLPQDGMEITGLGRISLYESRGSYQVILEYVEPRGVGALQKAFEQLKLRLSDEGLFDPVNKKPIACLPSKIALITSPTGAVIHDMLNIACRRFENIHIKILPVKVQGDGAVEQIVEAIDILNKEKNIDLAILARGGGSLEDLQAFNSEKVARAIYASEVPIVSAVGHETDYTISDFVADLRAPTPSAAVEMVIPVKNELNVRCKELLKVLIIKMLGNLENNRLRFHHIRHRLVNPRKRIQDHLLRVDDLYFRLIRVAENNFQQYRERLSWKSEKLWFNNPEKSAERFKLKIEQFKNTLQLSLKIYLDKKRSHLRELTFGLAAMNPSAILARGYSITRALPEKSIVRDADSVGLNQQLEITLQKGFLTCRIEGKQYHE
jgi:exodeoxyribonuclease VII large subunit